MYGYNQPYYNPTLENQINRLNQMQMPNYPQYPQGYPQATQTPQTTIKAVTSIEEVKAFTPAFDGSKTYFEDITNNTIYVKYLGMNGLPILEAYTKTQLPQTPNNEYVSKQEFEVIKNKINQYDTVFKELMGGNANDESNANVTNA